jgi:hypothetical protein
VGRRRHIIGGFEIGKTGTRSGEVSWRGYQIPRDALWPRSVSSLNLGHGAAAASASVEPELFMGVVWGDTETHGNQGGVVSIAH